MESGADPNRAGVTARSATHVHSARPRQVLDVVDALFLEQAAHKGHLTRTPSLNRHLVRHDAARDDMGLVELWPLAAEGGRY